MVTAASAGAPPYSRVQQTLTHVLNTWDWHRKRSSGCYRSGSFGTRAREIRRSPTRSVAQLRRIDVKRRLAL